MYLYANLSKTAFESVFCFWVRIPCCVSVCICFPFY